MQPVGGIVRLAFIQQQDAVQRLNLRVSAVLLHQLRHNAPGGRVVVQLKQRANVVLLYLQILGVLRRQRGKLGPGFVGLSAAHVVVRQDHHAPGIIRKIVRGLAKHYLRVGLFALAQKHLGKTLAGGDAFGISGNGIAHGLFRLGPTRIRGIEIGQKQSWTYRFRVQFDRNLKLVLDNAFLVWISVLDQGPFFMKRRPFGIQD